MEQESKESTVAFGAIADNLRRRNLTPARNRAAPKAGPRKKRVSFHLTEDLAERLRNAVYHLSGPPHRLTMAALAESALHREVSRLEKEANEGERFPSRSEELSGGRGVGR